LVIRRDRRGATARDFSGIPAQIRRHHAALTGG
jgi:hypothetical protein